MSIDGSQAPRKSNDSRAFSIAFFGRRCALSQIPLARLVASGATVKAAFVPSPVEFGPALRRHSTRELIPLGVERLHHAVDTIDRIATRNSIALYSARRPLAGELESVLRAIDPDLIVVSCFPWRLPGQVRRLATCGAINLHPSLLPRFRGPDPLFWAFQTGTKDWGVTVHRMDDAFDAGPILGQRRFDIPDGIAGDNLEALVRALRCRITRGNDRCDSCRNRHGFTSG